MALRRDLPGFCHSSALKDKGTLLYGTKGVCGLGFRALGVGSRSLSARNCFASQDLFPGPELQAYKYKRVLRVRLAVGFRV